jgi:cell wall-associated NlpC family hydrolase
LLPAHVNARLNVRLHVELTSRVSALLTGVALSMAVATASAAPDPSLDPVSRLLVERGLMAAPTAPGPGPGGTVGSSAQGDAPAPSAESPFVQQVRDRASDMVLAAMNFLGVPYRRGGNSAESGFDCSGFTRHIFEMSLGLVLPRRADDQANAPGLFAITKAELKPGDLVFFNTLRRTFSHVGIYVGDGKFIHSPRTGQEVRIEDMRMAYWQQRFTGARRVEALSGAPASAVSSAPSPAVDARSVRPVGLRLPEPVLLQP